MKAASHKLRNNSCTTKDELDVSGAHLRSLIGAKRKEKTRAALLQAGIRVFDRMAIDAAKIDDFIVEAGVARGTFYNYFPDVAAVQMAIAIHLAELLNERIRCIYVDFTDPAERVAIAVRHFLKKAMADPKWCRLVLNFLNHTQFIEMMHDSARPDIKAGLANGRFKIPSEEIGIDIVLGVGFMAIRSVLHDQIGENFSEDIASAILMGLGVNCEDAKKIVEQPLPSIK